MFNRDCMIRTIYFIILAYFVLGFAGFFIINRKKEPAAARSSWIKFITYFVIIHVLFFSIVINPLVFRLLAVVIIAGGFYELYKVYRKSGQQKKLVFTTSVILYILLAGGFFVYSGYDSNL